MCGPHSSAHTAGKRCYTRNESINSRGKYHQFSRQICLRQKEGKQYGTENAFGSISLSVHAFQFVGCSQAVCTQTRCSSKKSSCLGWRQPPRDNLIYKNPFASFHTELNCFTLGFVAPLTDMLMFIHTIWAIECAHYFKMAKMNNATFFLYLYHLFFNIPVFRLLHHHLWCLVVNTFIKHVGSQDLS